MAELILLREAIRNLVHDGDTVAMEGFTHLIPFAAAHEIIRQQKKDLTLVRMTPAWPGRCSGRRTILSPENRTIFHDEDRNRCRKSK
jgi:acyl CoA:acetate/3-ketoacid CoA transferase alpha subunit